MVANDAVQCPLCSEEVRAGDFKCHLSGLACIYRHLGEGNSDGTRRPLAAMGNISGEEHADLELVPCPYCERNFAKGPPGDT